LHKIIRRCAKQRQVKRHPSPLHLLFRYHPQMEPDRMETIVPFTRSPHYQAPWKMSIAKTREESIATERNSGAPWKVYTDGSANHKGVGGAAILYHKGNTRANRTIRMYAGPARRHGNYEGEAVGAILGTHLLNRE